MSFIGRLKSLFYKLILLANKPGNMPYYLHGISLPLIQELNVKWLQYLKLRTILDIGANVGQFAQAARAVFPYAKVYSFEPIPKCFVQLEKQMKNDDKFQALNIGLGASNGSMLFEYNQYSPSSSFLKMTNTHTNAFPHTAKVENIEVRIERLDAVVGRLDIQQPLLIKLDVQGYENQVLEGGGETFRKAKVVIIETSFTTLYANLVGVFKLTL